MPESIPTKGGSTAARPNRDIAFSSHRTVISLRRYGFWSPYHAGHFTNDGELSAQHVLMQLFMGISNERAILLRIAAGNEKIYRCLVRCSVPPRLVVCLPCRCHPECAWPGLIRGTVLPAFCLRSTSGDSLRREG